MCAIGRAEEKGNFKAAAIFGFDESNVDCGRNTRRRSVGVRRHEGNSLDPRKDDFMKLIMLYSHFFQEIRKTGLFVSYDLLCEEAIKKARSLTFLEVVLKSVKDGP
jgi:hypothetical protein